MKVTMRVVSAINLALYRRSNGRVMGRMRGMPVLLLTVPGRKTGIMRTNPVIYLEHDSTYVVAGSAHGADIEPAWFRNLRAVDSARIQVGDRHLVVKVEIAAGEQRSELWRRLVERGPFFGAYQKKTDREIPLAVLRPSAA
jgi:deazaflavin-dependent oxidoreductase (nitroreductase family)